MSRKLDGGEREYKKKDHRVDDVPQISAQPVEFADHEGFSIASCLRQEARPVVPFCRRRRLRR